MLVSLVLGLGLEHSCPWPLSRECLSSERLSLALASDFFCVLGLGLEPCVLDSTSGYFIRPTSSLSHMIPVSGYSIGTSCVPVGYLQVEPVSRSIGTCLQFDYY